VRQTRNQKLEIRTSSGFSLVELLVVIAIVGVLIALLLPAVQAARESARRTQCVNNLKQIGLASLNFYDAGRVMPTGGDFWSFSITRGAGGHAAYPPKQQIGWTVQILPFLEESQVQDIQDENILRKTPIACYFCPSRRGMTVKTNFYGVRAMNDYCGVVGPGNEWNAATYPNHAVIVHYPAVVRMKDITDGTTRSAMFSEKRMEPDAYEIIQNPWYDDQGYYQGWDGDTIRMTHSNPNLVGTNSYVLAMDAPLPTGFPATALGNSLGSAHAAGVYAVFADGSVRMISYEINQQVLDSLSNRHDGLVVEMTGVN
jgi:prepilin-type N-terminal cleavage/methylation domain-containing protein